MSERSMVESTLILALDEYIGKGTRSEQQLATLAKDLIQLTGDDKRTIVYLNKKAGQVMNGEKAWR